MQFYQKLIQLRKSAGLSQEQLAEKAGVSRQTIFKWESGLASPSMENLLVLCRIFDISADELIGNESECVQRQATEPRTDTDGSSEESVTTSGGQSLARLLSSRFRFEYKSKRTLFGVPLVHVCIGAGMCRARGIVAVGNLACGFLSVGILSVGLFSFGVLAFGLIAVAALALGGFALGAIAAGLMAVGSVAFGVIAVGSLAVGVYSVGAAAFASEIAATSSVTGYAKAPVVVADGIPKGSWTLLVSDYESLKAAGGSAPQWILRILASVL